MKFLNRIEEYILLITFPLMTGITIAGTTVRYLQLGTLTWSEEAARYLMVIAAFAGISLGFRENSHLGLGFLVGILPEKCKKAAIWVRTILIVVFGCLISYYTLQMILKQMTVTQYSPAMRIPMWIVYIPMLAGCVMMTVRAVQAAFAMKEEKQEVI